MKILHLKYKDGIGGAESILLMFASRQPCPWDRPGPLAPSRPAGAAANAPHLEHHFIINRPGILIERLSRHTLHVHAMPFNLAGVFCARSYVRQFGIDVIHAHGARANLIAAFAARLTGAPVVATEHSAGDPWRRRKLMNAIDRWASRRNFRRVAVSDAARQTLLKHRIVPADKIVVIPNGVDTQRFRPGAAPGALLVELGVEGARPIRVVANVGRLAKEKGQSFFIRAAAEVARQRDDVVFAIAGDGPLRGELEELARELGLGARLRFLGRRDDVEEILRATDVFCLSSLWEGLPVSLLEAMASGCACVATRVAGVPQLIDDGHTGRLVEAESVEALAAALTETLANPQKAETMGRHARELVSREYGVDKMIDRYTHVYRDAIQSRGS